MEFLAVVDPKTLEPRVVCHRLPGGGTDKASVPGEHHGLDSRDESRFAESGGQGFMGGDSIEAGLLAFETDDWVKPSEALIALTTEWESKAETLGKPVDYVPRFLSSPLGQTVTQARVAFREGCVPDVLKLAGAPGAPFKPTAPTDTDESGKQILVSAITPMFHDDDTLAVVVAPFETLTDAGLALAYGLAYAGDRELVLILGRHHVEPTLRRAAFLDAPIRVYSYEARTVLGRWTFDLQEEVLPAALVLAYAVTQLRSAWCSANLTS